MKKIIFVSRGGGGGVASRRRSYYPVRSLKKLETSPLLTTVQIKPGISESLVDYLTSLRNHDLPHQVQNYFYFPPTLGREVGDRREQEPNSA